MLNRLLFIASVLLGIGLIVLAIVGPWCGHIAARSELFRLFAEDILVRRTALLCGLGLLATAAIFFRPAMRSASSAK